MSRYRSTVFVMAVLVWTCLLLTPPDVVIARGRAGPGVEPMVVSG
jgi:hypothetical protein